MTTLDQFRRAYYAKLISHDPDYDRDRSGPHMRRTVVKARTWQEAADFAGAGSVWQVAAVNRCLPSEL